MDIELKLTVNEVNALLQVLGELPTKSRRGIRYCGQCVVAFSCQ